MLAVRSGRRVTVGNRSEIVTKYQVNDGVDSWLGIYTMGRKLGGPIYLRGSPRGPRGIAGDSPTLSTDRASITSDPFRITTDLGTYHGDCIPIGPSFRPLFRAVRLSACTAGPSRGPL